MYDRFAEAWAKVQERYFPDPPGHYAGHTDEQTIHNNRTDEQTSNGTAIGEDEGIGRIGPGLFFV